MSERPESSLYGRQRFELTLFNLKSSITADMRQVTTGYA